MSSAAFQQLGALLHCELRLRSRRPATLVVLLAVLALTWLSLADPTSGHALMVAGEQRLRYSSDTLAFGSSILGAVLLSLAGFYLARGRTQEDLLSGMAGVLASSPISNRLLLTAHWMGGFAYLLGLGLALLLSTWLLQTIRGEGPLQPWVYLRSYALILAPALAVSAAFAVLADAWAPLAGRRGDVAWFFLWVMLLSLIPFHEATHGTGLLLLHLLDISGLATVIAALEPLIGQSGVAIGGSPFRAELGLLEFPDGLWTWTLAAQRGTAALLALLPLGLALAGFHRYAPERVRRGIRTPSHLAGWLGRLLGLPLLARAAAALLTGAARLPGPLAAGAAELLLSLATQPLAVWGLVMAWLASALVPADTAWALQASIAAGWGLLAAELGARDARSATEALGASLPGGRSRRTVSRWAAALALGLIAGAPLAAMRGPGYLLSWSVGLAGLAAAAGLLGRLSGGSRAFLALFLFWLLVAVQVRDLPALDWLGFNGQWLPG